MTLQLTRPLIILDLETTGLDVSKDRIIQIGLIKWNVNGEEERYESLVNPEMPISPESSEITGISNEMVSSAPTFAEISDQVAAFIGDGDLAGYNSNKFDIPVLAEEFLRVQHSFSFGNRKFVDVQNIFHKMEQRTLAAAYQFYCQKTMENAHSAMYDSAVTLEVFKAQLEKYADLPNNIDDLSVFTRQGNNEIADFAGRLSRNAQGKVCYNFGKHKGKTVEEISEVEPGYFGWMLDADFPLYTKQVLRAEMERIKSERRDHKPAVSPKPRTTGPELSIEDKLKALQDKFKK